MRSKMEKELTGKPVTPYEYWSGREDLNLRPPAPKAGALARLRHAPNFFYSVFSPGLLCKGGIRFQRHAGCVFR